MVLFPEKTTDAKAYLMAVDRTVLCSQSFPIKTRQVYNLFQNLLNSKWDFLKVFKGVSLVIKIKYQKHTP